MSDIRDYVTRSEAAQIVGVVPGYVWDHLSHFAPQVEQVSLFGFTAVRRDELQDYCENGRALVKPGPEPALNGVSKSRLSDNNKVSAS